MFHFRKISSLKEKATVQVAINLCQENNFKEVALCLEKPTYGTCSTSKRGQENVEQLGSAIDEQCEKLTKGLPNLLKHGIQAWINRIALEYLSYCRRQEVLFGVSRYFLMDVFTQKDWMIDGRLNEDKLTERLLKDERLTVLQRYKIACVYCKHVNIPQLWKRLTQEEKQSIFIQNSNKNNNSLKIIPLVKTLSYYMERNEGKRITWRNNPFETFEVDQAVCHGNRAVMIPCWERLQEQTRQKMVMYLAFQSLQKWQSNQHERFDGSSWENELVSKELSFVDFKLIRLLNLPFYYSELMCFFLSQMHEEQKLIFFKKAFNNPIFDTILECFLDWPHQDDFLPTINRLWGIVPKVKYGQLLLTLASKYSGVHNDGAHFFTLLHKKEKYYDYRSLLWRLWDETPHEYKRYVFCINKPYIASELLPGLLEKSPFLEKDMMLFKRILHDMTQEERIAMIRSKTGENICWILLQKKRFSFADWLLEECLPKEEIFNFKIELIQSNRSCSFCFCKLKEHHEDVLEDLINWSLELEAEKVQFKYKLVYTIDCLNACSCLLSKEKFTEVERIINFCLSSGEMKEQIKIQLARDTCSILLQDRLWKQADKILTWTFDDKENIQDFKKDLFYSYDMYKHMKQLFMENELEKIGCYYNWFCPSTEEMKIFGRQTIFDCKIIKDIYTELLFNYHDTKRLATFFSWFLTNEEIVYSFKKQVEDECFKEVAGKKRLKANEKSAKERLDCLVDEILCGFSEGKVQDKRIKEDSFVKNNEGNRSIVIEDESLLPKKRLK